MESRFPAKSAGRPLRSIVFRKQWRDRGIEAAADVTRYVLSRIERSFEGVARTVDALDKAALSQQRPLSIPLAREVFIDLDLDER